MCWPTEQPNPSREFELACGFAHLHSIGGWPTVINDETTESCVSGEELVLLAKVRPVAEARITMRVRNMPGG